MVRSSMAPQVFREVKMSEAQRRVVAERAREVTKKATSAAPTTKSASRT